MSDKEGSLSRSGSRSLSRAKSPDSDRSSRKTVSPLSLSRSRSRSRSRSMHRYASRSRSRSTSRRRYHSRSRSRSPYHRRHRGRHSRSRSRSYGRHSSGHGGERDRDYRSRGSRSRHRSHSRSPMSNRRRHAGNRDDPKTSNCIGVFGLSLYTEERDLREIFGRFGPIDEVQVVYDHQTGRSRGFAFIYYRNLEDAEEAKETAPGTEIDGRRIRVDYSITERAHTPTPGIYLGKPTTYRRSDYNRRSASPGGYERRGSRHSYSRSRSRSYSPRRH